jgi:hypothetical protein
LIWRIWALFLDLTPSPPWNGGEGRGEEARGCPWLGSTAPLPARASHPQPQCFGLSRRSVAKAETIPKGLHHSAQRLRGTSYPGGVNGIRFLSTPTRVVADPTRGGRKRKGHNRVAVRNTGGLPRSFRPAGRGRRSAASLPRQTSINGMIPNKTGGASVPASRLHLTSARQVRPIRSPSVPSVCSCYHSCPFVPLRSARSLRLNNAGGLELALDKTGFRGKIGL